MKFPAGGAVAKLTDSLALCLLGSRIPCLLEGSPGPPEGARSRVPSIGLLTLLRLEMRWVSKSCLGFIPGIIVTVSNGLVQL